MRKSALRNLQIYVAESFDREDRLVFALRVDDILKRDPDFEVDELLIFRKKRDDLWTQEVRNREGKIVEGVRPGYISLGEAMLAAYGVDIASAGRHEVTVRALTDLYEDADFYIGEYADAVRDLVNIPEVAEEVERDVQRREAEVAEKNQLIAEARRRVDGDSQSE